MNSLSIYSQKQLKNVAEDILYGNVLDIPDIHDDFNGFTYVIYAMCEILKDFSKESSEDLIMDGYAPSIIEWNTMVDRYLNFILQFDVEYCIWGGRLALAHFQLPIDPKQCSSWGVWHMKMQCWIVR